MARRSNKTAHVLNLIAGQDAQKDVAEESASREGADTASADTSAKANAAPSQNVSVIDKTEKDPVADLIQQKLTSEFNKEHQEVSTEPTPTATSELEHPTDTAEEAAVEPAETPTATTEEAAVEPAETPTTAVEKIAVDPDATPITSASVPHTVPETKSPAADTVPTLAPATAAPTAAIEEAPMMPETAPAAPTAVIEKTPAAPEATPAAPVPEPDFACINVMERIVNDKIIYFMRQFDVCTCDRCKADTAALALNGLIPKYIVTSSAAVDPLMSYYTNRLISDVTVEATKACMIVKDNPRH